MATLLLRLQGPMQAWGVQSRFGVRDTGREPSKSGVIGLLCAALGRNREESVDDLAALKMGIRIDKPGRVMMDYHTTQNIMQANETKPPYSGHPKYSSVSRRYYLADAAFLAGLESDNNITLLKELHAALRTPQWMLFLGRKAFVPSPPVHLPKGLRDKENLIEAFREYPWLGADKQEHKQLSRQQGDQVRMMLEDEVGEIQINDQPISFAERQFAPRRVHMDWIGFPAFLTPETEAQENTL